MNNDVYQKIILFISEHLQIPISNINFNSRLGNDLNMDSLDLIDILMQFEDVFNVQINEEDAEGIITVNDVYDLLISKL
jgi:acyl carrier protein